MSTFAIFEKETGLCINTIVVEEGSNFIFEENYEYENIDNIYCGIGFTRVEEGIWSAPIQKISEENIEDPI
jgi:hypothetical protein